MKSNFFKSSRKPVIKPNFSIENPLLELQNDMREEKKKKLIF